MPSIEIVCVGQSTVTEFTGMPFLVESESRLVSHRAPYPLWQKDFDSLIGCIYHLSDGGNVTACDLLVRDWYDADGNSRDDEMNLQFKPPVASHVKRMLDALIASSPTHEVLFTSDYQ